MSINAIPQMHPLTRPLAWLLLRLTSRCSLIGREHFPPAPYCIVSNHISYADSIVASALTVESVPVFVAKKYQGTFLGKMMEIALASIWIEQEAPDRHALKTALQLLESGIPLGIAPEGTRSRTAQLKEAHDGAAFIIRKANVPIVPVGICGTEKMFKQLRPEVKGIVGKPFRLPPVERATKEVLKEDTDRIMCSIAALLPPEYHGFYTDHPMIEEMAKVVRP